MFQRTQLIVQQIPRYYLWWAPPEAPAAPIVLFLTGTGASPTWTDTETGWSSVASQQRFTLVYPEALPIDPRQKPHFGNNPTRWRDNDLVDPGTLSPSSPAPVSASATNQSVTADDQPAIDDVAFLDAVLQDIQQRRGEPAAAIFLTGFSNGAAMAFRYAFSRSDHLAAIAPVAGYCRCPTTPPLAHPLPTLYIIGDSDPLVPLHGGLVPSPWSARLVRRPPVVESLERWALLLGCSPIPLDVQETPVMHHQVYPGPVHFEVIFVKGLGHHWPGGQGGWSARIAGPFHRRFNATSTIWQFFQKQLLAV
jgi:polyhydroxybutyrate depolymerase